MKQLFVDSTILTRLKQYSYLSVLLVNGCSVVSASENAGVSADQLDQQLQQIVDGFDTYSGQFTRTDVMAFLRQQKRQFTVLWAIASLAECFDFQKLGEWWSLFAERSIDFALRAAWRLPEIKRLCRPVTDDTSTSVPGLFVLGLGKLGGRDLNFSSDVDLVAFYDADCVPVAPMQGKADVCTRVLKQMTRLLSDTTSQGLYGAWTGACALKPR